MELQQVLKRAGISARTLKEYRRLGLIPPPSRKVIGGRGFPADYPDWVIDHIRSIRRLQAKGFTLLQVRDLLLRQTRIHCEAEELVPKLLQEFERQKGRPVMKQETEGLRRTLPVVLGALQVDEVWRRSQHEPGFLDRLFAPPVEEVVEAIDRGFERAYREGRVHVELGEQVVTVRKDSDGTFWISCDVLPDCSAQGATEEEALKKMAEMMETVKRAPMSVPKAPHIRTARPRSRPREPRRSRRRSKSKDGPTGDGGGDGDDESDNVDLNTRLGGVQASVLT